MTAIGHVTLDGKEYRLRSLPVQAAANQMAPKVASGESEYSSLDTWSAWVQEDWQAGVGKTRPHRTPGGFLYGEAETRVPNQIILPQAPVICTALEPANDYSNWAFSPGQATDYTTLVLGNTYLAVNVDATNVGTLDVLGIWAYFQADVGTVVRADFYSDSAGSPGTSAISASATITADFPGPHWYKFSMTIEAVGTSTADYWIVFRVPTGSATFYGSATDPANMTVKTSTNGTVWTPSTTFKPFFNTLTDLDATSNADGTPSSIAAIVYTSSFGGALYLGPMAISATTYIGVMAHVDANSPTYFTHTNASAVAGSPTSAAIFLNTVYVALGAGSNVVGYTLGGVPVVLGSAVAATVLFSLGGYLYRALGNDLYYTADEVTWTTVGVVCTDPYDIRSMAGIDGTLHLACDDGLYQLAPGDFIVPVAPWPASVDNGKSMVSHQGALYITVNGRVWRYTSDGSMSDVWISRDDDLPANRLGEVVSLATSDTGVLAMVREQSASGRSSIWTLQGTGWHHLCTLPTDNGSAMYYDRDHSRLHIGTTNGQVFYLDLPPYAINPYNDTGSLYTPAGWVEWDWFRGNIREVDKDFESVTLMGEFDTGTSALVYWKDDASTGWELLGTVDADGEELRWSSSATRPNSKKIKLGILLRTTDPTLTPKIEAVRVKYHTMVSDWFRWTLAIDVSGGQNGGKYQELLNNEPSTYTADQIKDNLDALVKKVGPFVYKDIDGTQYEVKVKEGSQFNYTVVRYNDTSASKEWEGVYSLVIEQVTNSVYTP